MLVLAIETATDLCGLALLEEDRLISEMNFRHRMSLSQRLAPNLEYLLRDSEKTLQAVDLIAVSTGPGSFTGLRVGVVMAKTLAWTLEKPLAGVPTLEALASGLCIQSDPDTLLCPILHARRGEVYTAVYRPSSDKFQDSTESIPRLFPLFPPEALEDSLLLERLAGIKEPLICLGDGAMRLRDTIREVTHGRALFVSGILNYPRAEWIGHLGYRAFQEGWQDDPLHLTPVYLKKSIAEIRQEKR